MKVLYNLILARNRREVYYRLQHLPVFLYIVIKFTLPLNSPKPSVYIDIDGISKLGYMTPAV